jgi:maltose alpha-D-glucosyltransferase/alpha-amylase
VAAVEAAVRDLDLATIAAERWFVANDSVPSGARVAHAFALSDAAVLALVDLRVGERTDRYAMAFDASGDALRLARDGDGTWRALAAAIAEGRTLAAMPPDSVLTGPSAALVCAPSRGLSDLWDVTALGPVAAAEERPLGRDQSNTSVVLDERLVLKAYRRIQPGLNPDLELTAYLSEEAAFAGVPRLAGSAEVVTRDAGVATVAMLQAFVPGGEDAYESTAERLAELFGGSRPTDLEADTDIAEDLGILVAGLHAALASPPADAPDLAPRPAGHDDLRAWRIDATGQLNAAVAALATVDRVLADELRADAPEITARISRFEAVATAPLVMRIHADLHLGQVLIAHDGYRVIDFEGEPLRPIEDRRRLDSPLRDVASMLRSLDHVARSARRRAEARAGGRLERPGLEVDAWLDRARDRFLAAYAITLERTGAPITVDLDLLDAFEVAKEAYEFEYAATVLPTWLWAPRDGMRWLLARGGSA